MSGSPTGFNMVRVQGLGINPTPSVDGCPTIVGPFADCAETDLFSVSGKVMANGPAATTGGSTVSFGTVTGAVTKNLTYTSIGSANAQVTSVAISGANAADFTATNNCTAAVAPGSNCSIAVRFASRIGADSTASLTIVDNTPGSPRTIALSGRAAATVPGRTTIGTPTKGNASALVRWTAPVATGGSAITGYTIRVTNSVSNAPE